MYDTLGSLVWIVPFASIIYCYEVEQADGAVADVLAHWRSEAAWRRCWPKRHVAAGLTARATHMGIILPSEDDAGKMAVGYTIYDELH